MTYLLVLGVVLFSFVLIKAADVVVTGVRGLSRGMGTSRFAFAAIVLVLGTSFPELFVGVTSAFEGYPNLAFGVVVGSNIANLALIGAFASLLAGRVRVYGEFLRRDVYVSFFSGFLPVLLILDKVLSRVDGLILLFVYASYAVNSFRSRAREAEEVYDDSKPLIRFFRSRGNEVVGSSKEIARFLVGIAVMLFSADMVVKLAQDLAVVTNTPIFLVGLFVVAVGTSLPELAFSIKSLRAGEPEMFFGNILGSIIANSTLILGVTSLISEIRVDSLGNYLVSVVVMAVTFTLFWTFIQTKRRLDRWEAILLITLYFVFVYIEFL